MSDKHSVIGGSGGGGCFRAGTLVQQQRGKQVAIELLKEGDEVLAFDEAGDVHLAKVTKVHYHEDPQPILKVKFWSGEVFITPNHWVLNQYGSFVEMGKLTSHDALVDGMGHLRPIIGAELVGYEPVWNLTVEPHHTFIANGIRVHNGGHRERFPTVAGSGGGGGGGKGSGGRAAVEDKDSLQSKAMMSLLDLLGEGQIGGLVDGAKSIFLDGTPLQSPSGTYNFTLASWEQRVGTQDQTFISGFSDVESPFDVRAQVKKDTPHTVTITNQNADYCRVIATFPSLTSTDVSTGDIHGTSVKYKFSVSTDGGPFVDIASSVKTTPGGDVTFDPDGTMNVSAPAGKQGVQTSISISGAVGVSSIEYQPQYWDESAGVWVNYTKASSVAAKARGVLFGASRNITTAATQNYGGVGIMKLRFLIVSKTLAPAEQTYNAFGDPLPLGAPQDIGLAAANTVVFEATPEITVTGKSRSYYQRHHLIALPKPGSMWQVRMTRITADSLSSAITNDTYFDSYVEVVDSKLSYPNSALVGLKIDSSQFNQIPKRAYLVDGLYIQVPSNYDVASNTYVGIWNGTLKPAVSGNPAWVLYDVLVNKRYGLGRYIKPSQIDKAALYRIGRYCDEMVSDGYGGLEPRFRINTQIQTQTEAFKLIADIASAFRGMSFWNGGMACFTQDSPTDPDFIYTNANVVEGIFSYSGSAKKDRHSVALITWNDPNENYKQKIEYVENADLIRRFGVRKADAIAFACTSRGQAHRMGQWILYTEMFESDMIQFSVGIDSAFVLPGSVVKLHDQFRDGRRMGGRLVSCSLTSAVIDAPVELTGIGSIISVRMPDGTFADREIIEGAGSHTSVTWALPLADTPVANAIWVMAEPTSKQTLARVISVAQKDTDPNLFDVVAIEHNPAKYQMVESGYAFETFTSALLSSLNVEPVYGLAVESTTYMASTTTVGIKAHISWSGSTPFYEVSWRRVDDNFVSNWETVTVNSNSTDIDSIVPGAYEFQVVAIAFTGRRSVAASISTVLNTGVVAQPATLTGITLSAMLGSIVFQCEYPTDVTTSGILVHVGSTANFTPDATTLSYKGTNSQCVISTHPNGTPFAPGEHVFVKVAGYSTISSDPINWSADIEVVVPTATSISANVLTLSTSSTVFQVKKDGSNSPNSIMLSAVCTGGLTGVAAFTTSALDAVLTGTGNTRTVDLAGMGANDYITVTATIADASGTYQDQVTIIKVREGIDSTAMSLSNEAVTLAAANDPTGTVVDYTPAQTDVKVFIGAVEDTANWTLSKADSAGVVTSIIAGKVCVSTMTLDSAYTDITMTPGPSRSMYAPITKRFSMSKSRAGAAGTDGTIYTVIVESTHGSIFRIGQFETTDLIARVFRNGTEVTADIPASQFCWRRVSFIPQPYPNDDATWNALYASGHKTVSVTADSVMAKATFHCDIVETV